MALLAMFSIGLPECIVDIVDSKGFHKRGGGVLCWNGLLNCCYRILALLHVGGAPGQSGGKQQQDGPCSMWVILPDWLGHLPKKVHTFLPARVATAEKFPAIPTLGP